MKKELNSFKYALHGLKCAYKSEAHLRFHCLMAIAVIICGFLFHLSLTEWLICLVCISMVITTELINTAIEATVDLATKEQKLLAQKAKDVAAGAVLISALISAVIGLIIFVPKGIYWLQTLFIS